MGLRIHNTLSRELEPFEPLEAGRAKVYGCGPTVYDHAHIGNFRTFLFFDLVHRYLAWKGYDVRFVMNVTDVDDKTIRAAGEAGTTLREYTEPFIRSFLDECDALGVRRFSLYPRATDYVDRMIELVRTLLDRGLAYVAEDGSVFFDISAFPGYGRLSGKDLEQVRTGERVAADEYGKDDVRDFALWKAAKPADEAVGGAWDSPWGRGRPGWHLECSAMALAELGETLDLHLGGEDLVFPHHEDEIAQSEGVTGRTFVRQWLHVKHLLVEGRKMSKSLGNFVTVRGLLDEGVSPAALRHLLLSAQYRSELNFTRAGLEASARAVGRLLDFEARLREGGEAGHRADARAGASPGEGSAGGGRPDAREAPPPGGEPEDGRSEGDDEGRTQGRVEGLGEGSGGRRGEGRGERGGRRGEGRGELRRLAGEALEAFERAMDDDFNVSGAMGSLFVFVNRANALLDEHPDVPRPDREAAIQALESIDRVLGLVELGRRERTVDRELERWVEERIEARARARRERDWKAADAIRDELAARGIVLEDGAGGTRWKRVGS